MSLKRWARSLPDWAEFIVVVTVAFGYFIVDSILRLLAIDATPYFAPLSLRHLVLCESFLLVAVGLFLYLRGWSFADFGRRPTVPQFFVGVPLAVAAYLSTVVLYAIFSTPSAALSGRGTPVNLTDVDGLTTAIGAAVNSIFEEILVVGYVMRRIAGRFGSWSGVHVSALIRLACHAHQGAVAILSILPIGYLFAYWYARRRSLLPLVVAHTILDAVAFALYRLA